MIELFVEAYRLHLLRGLEEGLARCGYGLIAGVDEVGRGSLAGPVVAAAVIVDSRCLSRAWTTASASPPPERERAAEAIRAAAVAFAVAEIPPEIIDRINILEATRLAMREALVAPAARRRTARWSTPCASPASASPACRWCAATASATPWPAPRSSPRWSGTGMMVELGRVYPQYGFAAHKGYGGARAPGGAGDLRALRPSTG